MKKEHNNLSASIVNASKWSTITTISTRIITPLIQMLLARILMPKDFGIVAIVTIVISFGQMFTDAGFHKYIIQRNFAAEKDYDRASTVAFWTNLFISVVVWIVVIIAAKPLARALGDVESATAIRVAAFQIVVFALCCIQNARRQRKMDFKTLFVINLVTIIVPAFASVPLALWGYGYWALVAGNMTGVVANAAVLWLLSPWKPSFYFNFNLLKDMFSFSIWSMAESIVIWLVIWVDAIIIGSSLDVTKLGLYRNSVSIVNVIVSILSSPILPVMFASLSRLQNDNGAFNSLYINVRKTLAAVLIPSGIGMFLFGNVISRIVFGDRWTGAGEIIGMWGLASCVIALFSMTGEVYRAKGMPAITVKVSLLHLCFLVPTCLISVRYGFWTLLLARTLVRFQTVPFHLHYLRKLTGIKFRHLLFSERWIFIASAFMVCTFFIPDALMQSQGILISLLKMFICGIVYTAALMQDKEFVVKLLQVLGSRKAGKEINAI